MSERRICFCLATVVSSESISISMASYGGEVSLHEYPLTCRLHGRCIWAEAPHPLHSSLPFASVSADAFTIYIDDRTDALLSTVCESRTSEIMNKPAPVPCPTSSSPSLPQPCTLLNSNLLISSLIIIPQRLQLSQTHRPPPRLARRLFPR